MKKHYLITAAAFVLLVIASGTFLSVSKSRAANKKSAEHTGHEMPSGGDTKTAPNGGNGGGGMKPTTAPELTEAQKTQLAAGEAAHAPKELTFEVRGGMFWYVPNAIKVKKGDKVKINFISDNGTHDFTLDEFNVKIGSIKTGETASAEFVADKAGSFEYYCSVGRHRQMGQKGTFVVEE